MGNCLNRSRMVVVASTTTTLKSLNNKQLQSDLISSQKSQNHSPSTQQKIGKNELINNVTSLDHYNVMISYCHANRKICHHLADRLIDLGFHVWIDRDKMSGDLYSAMADAIDTSDCSEHNFNIQFDKLVPDIHTKRGPPMKLPERAPVSVKEKHERDVIYKQKCQAQIERDAVLAAEMKSVLQIIEMEVIKEYKGDDFDEETMEIDLDLIDELLPIRRWLKKYPQVTISNLLPKSETSDGNDAPFELPTDVAEKPTVYLRSWLKNYKRFECGIYHNPAGPYYSTPAYLGDTPITQAEANANFQALITRNYKRFECGIYHNPAGPYYSTPAYLDDKTITQAEANAYFQALITRNWSFNTSMTHADRNGQHPGYIGNDRKTEKQMQRRAKLDNPKAMIKRRLELAKYFFGNYNPNDKEIQRYLKFAERMHQNKVEWDAFLIEYESKQK
ncbi:unnamed protein product [Didymodactylos carnosus]|uniref:TIR domain-containing protein n=1 Tax=Didymodactylos carnosus TaxID=1234261 RepID=A0A814I9X2_9BILA|nr:unnamed protein product [Didymodactylos carnosus]CAF1114742.1 unnamed protein product [Didymodactylos carnosus]CAF3792453.1 unnamed protein product [Didymodactylos carnosus]CAF3884536.1 unnamed protein product [Didymodactylos carnosus]